MKYLLTNPFLILFLVIPPSLLLIKYKCIPKINFLTLISIQTVLGWALINGGCFYYDIQLKNELKKYNYEYDSMHDANIELISEVQVILKKIRGDGGRNIFTFIFGWLYALLYFVPYLIVYLLLSILKNKSV